MVTGIYEVKTLTKHVSYECKCKLDSRKFDSNQKWNNNKCRCECKQRHICEKDYIWNPATCSCENGKYLASIINDSVITCDEVIEETVPTNSNEKRQPVNTKFLYFIYIFINYCSYIDSCLYLLLPDKI